MRNQGHLFVDMEDGKVYRDKEIRDNKWGYCYDAENNFTYLMRITEWDYDHLNEWQKQTMEENKQMCGYHVLLPAGGVSKEKFHENVDEYRWYSAEKIASKVGLPGQTDKNIIQFNYLRRNVEDADMDILKWFVYVVFGMDESVERHQFSTVQEFIDKTSCLYGYV